MKDRIWFKIKCLDNGVNHHYVIKPHGYGNSDIFIHFGDIFSGEWQLDEHQYAKNILDFILHEVYGLDKKYVYRHRRAIRGIILCLKLYTQRFAEESTPVSREAQEGDFCIEISGKGDDFAKRVSLKENNKKMAEVAFKLKKWSDYRYTTLIVEE